MTPAEYTAYVTASCKASGVKVPLDTATARAVLTILVGPQPKKKAA